MVERTIKVEQIGNGQRRKMVMSKPKRWTHQSVLDDLVGQGITLKMSEQAIDDRVTGRLLAADQFAFQIELSNKSVVTYFKHAVKSFQSAVLF